MKELSIGIDIGGTNTVFGIVDQQGEIYGEGAISTTRYPDIDEYVEELFIAMQQMLTKLNFDYKLVGIGIGAPKANYYKGTIEDSANLPWKGVVPLVDKIKVFYPNVPVIMTNDANAAAIGEMEYGGAKGMRDFIVVTLGTGLGSGFVANGELILGDDSFAGELGHVVINPKGRMCGCGRVGCLETYVSATGIKRTIYKLLADSNEPNSLREVSYKNLTAAMITDEALAGNPLAIEAYEYTGMLLGQTLADAVAETSPEAIFLFGGLAKAGDLIFEPTIRHMENELLPIFRNKVKVLPSGIEGKNAAVLGASALIWQRRNADSTK